MRLHPTGQFDNHPAATRIIKQAMDPNGLLNPGRIFIKTAAGRCPRERKI
jgi:FAD/FMN-containing dehydrogenase